MKDCHFSVLLYVLKSVKNRKKIEIRTPIELKYTMMGVVIIHRRVVSWKRKAKVTTVSLLRHLNMILRYE